MTTAIEGLENRMIVCFVDGDYKRVEIVDKTVVYSY